jgi:hypothetical protein
MVKVFYKVLMPDLTSTQRHDLNLVTKYKIGEFVCSPEPLTPLCVFKSLRLARKFRECQSLEYIIYECEIKNKYRIPWIPYKWDNKRVALDIVRLKKQHKSIEGLVYTSLPNGTVCCGQVKLIKQVF